MGAIYIQLNNSFMKRPITHDYTDPSSSLGVSDKDLYTNLQKVIYGEISGCNAGYSAFAMSFHSTGSDFRVKFDGGVIVLDQS